VPPQRQDESKIETLRASREDRSTQHHTQQQRTDLIYVVQAPLQLKSTLPFFRIQEWDLRLLLLELIQVRNKSKFVCHICHYPYYCTYTDGTRATTDNVQTDDVQIVIPTGATNDVHTVIPATTVEEATDSTVTATSMIQNLRVGKDAPDPIATTPTITILPLATTIRAAIDEAMATLESRKVSADTTESGAPQPIKCVMGWMMKQFEHNKKKGARYLPKTAHFQAAMERYRRFFPYGDIVFTIPKDRALSSTPSPFSAPSPFYHSIEGAQVFVVDWQVSHPDHHLHCPTCDDETLEHDRFNFTKNGTLVKHGHVGCCRALQVQELCDKSSRKRRVSFEHSSSAYPSSLSRRAPLRYRSLSLRH
jgi:hypothetical protein